MYVHFGIPFVSAQEKVRPATPEEKDFFCPNRGISGLKATAPQSDALDKTVAPSFLAKRRRNP